MTLDEDREAADGLYVVETTDGEIWLGQIAFQHGAVVVLSGFVGRPRVIAQCDVQSITPASEHPDVEIPRQRR